MLFRSVDETFPVDHITEDLIYKTAQQFVGDIAQIPPMFSAIKMAGVRMYDLARQGKTREITSRNITIETFEITNITMPKVQFRIVCSKGTYIRSLAYDFGKALNSGGHLSQLRRTKIGDFNVKDAVEIEDFIANL